jgi:uncharacterized protein YgiM (DUF1202 family)
MALSAAAHAAWIEAENLEALKASPHTSLAPLRNAEKNDILRIIIGQAGALMGKTVSVVCFFLCICLNAFSDGGAKRPLIQEVIDEKWASAGVNVRTGPGVKFDVMGQLYKNEKVEIFDVIGGWAKISFEGVEAYVSSEYLLPERIKTPEEEKAALEAAEKAAEIERQRLEDAQKELRIFYIKKIALFSIVGILGFILIGICLWNRMG